MKFFISDLHLGDGSKADDFHYTGEFLGFLDFAKENCEELVIVGDFFELWQCDLDKIIFCHHKVIEGLLSLAKERRFVYIIGNHDHVPFVKYIDSSIDVALEYNDEKINLHAEHGNQYDVFNRYKDPTLAVKNRWGRTASYICGWAERVIHPDIDEWTAKVMVIKNKVPPSSAEYIKRGGDFSEYERAAMALINNGKKIVIFGHTHRAKMVKFKKGIYVNCGAWCGSVKPTYVAVDGEKAELKDAIKHSVIRREKWPL